MSSTIDETISRVDVEGSSLRRARDDEEEFNARLIPMTDRRGRGKTVRSVQWKIEDDGGMLDDDVVVGGDLDDDVYDDGIRTSTSRRKRASSSSRRSSVGKSSSSSSSTRKRSRTLELSISNDDLMGGGGGGVNVNGGGGADETEVTTTTEDEDSKYERVPFFEKKRELEAVDRFCFGCRYGFSPNTKDPEMRSLFEMFADNIATRRDTELAEEMHEYHEKYIRGPRLARGEPCEEWPSNMILIHIRTHQFFPRVELLGSVQTVRVLQKVVENSIVSRHRETQVEKTDYEAIRNWVMLERLKQSLLKESSAKYTAINEDVGMER